MDHLMDTMLHELSHNVHGEHDKNFYALFEELQGEMDLLTSKGYQGEGFFSQGQRLGNGHRWYKPKTVLSAADRRKLKDSLERKENGIRIDPIGRRLGGPVLVEGLDVDPRQMAAMAAEWRAMDQKRCGQNQGGKDMKRERDKAQREGKRTQVEDIAKAIDVNDIRNYQFDDDLPDSLTAIPAAPSYPTYQPPQAASTSAGWQSDWNCGVCTVRNPPLFLSCSVCQAERKLQSTRQSGMNGIIDLTGDKIQSWDCRACTFKNENVASGLCIICGTAK